LAARVYAEKAENEVSSFQENPAQSLELIAKAGAGPDSTIIDIGGGASGLVDRLLEKGFRAITVLDLSAAAWERAKARLEADLGERAAQVQWLVADATRWQPAQTYDIWHDRAAFHFLTEPADRAAYVTRLKQALRIGGHAVIATFAPDGPERCSGLPVLRHDAASLGRELGQGFELVDMRRQVHTTPWGSLQSF
jgi:trans-aconitate methyltransferase